MIFQAQKKRLVVCATRGGLIQNHHVDAGQLTAFFAKRLPNDALQTITSCGQSTILFANGQPQARIFTTVVSVENGEHFVATARGLVEHTTKGDFVREPVVAPEALAGSGFGIGFRNGFVGLAALWRQLGPTF